MRGDAEIVVLALLLRKDDPLACEFALHGSVFQRFHDYPVRKLVDHFLRHNLLSRIKNLIHQLLKLLSRKLIADVVCDETDVGRKEVLVPKPLKVDSRELRCRLGLTRMCM
jgi:hypothetical protein